MELSGGGRQVRDREGPRIRRRRVRWRSWRIPVAGCHAATSAHAPIDVGAAITGSDGIGSAAAVPRMPRPTHGASSPDEDWRGAEDRRLLRQRPPLQRAVHRAVGPAAVPTTAWSTRSGSRRDAATVAHLQPWVSGSRARRAGERSGQRAGREGRRGRTATAGGRGFECGEEGLRFCCFIPLESDWSHWIGDPVNARPVALDVERATSSLCSYSYGSATIFSTLHTSTLSLSPTYNMIMGLTYILFTKNILSSPYELRFEYRLYRCVLRDEANKTKSHLHIFWICFALVATYI
jgi:hypothetical protein